MKRNSVGRLVLLILFVLGVPVARAAAIDTLNVDLSPLIDAAAGSKNRFAVDIVHSVTSSTDGQWTKTAGSSVWTYSVRIPGAVSMSFHAPVVNLPADAVLTVTAGSTSTTYSARDISQGGLWGRPLLGDTLSFMLSGDSSLQIRSFQAGYRALGGVVPDHPRYARIKKLTAADQSADCTQNYSCNVTDANQGPAQATVAVLIGNQFSCTGTLLNNTSGDSTPYVLTARHCENGKLGGGNPGAAQTITLYWDAVTPCGSTLGSIYAGGAITQYGAVTVVEQQDAWLIRLNSPPAASDAYFAGWDATGGVFTGGYSVHHALGYDKQYVGWYGQAVLEQMPRATVGVNYESMFWGLVNGVGNVGAGASGGAVFDPQNHVVGSASLAQLVGGENTAGVCPANPVPAPSAATETALYTALSGVWTSTADSTSTTGSHTLQSLLDPTNTGKMVINGFGMMPLTLTTDNPYPRTDQHLTLSWSVPSAQSCTATGGQSGDGWAGARPATGSVQVSSLTGGHVEYALNCQTADRLGHAVAAVDWTYIQPLAEVHSDPGAVMIGGLIYLFWDANVQPCTAGGGQAGDGWAGAKDIQGSQAVVAKRVGTTVFTLNCGTGARTASSQVSVTVVAPDVTLFSDAVRVRVGSYINLHWSSTGNNADCTPSGGAPGDGWAQQTYQSSGSAIEEETVAGTYTYTITCSGGGQSAHSSVSVEYTNDPPSLSLNANSSTQQIYAQGATDADITPDLTWTANTTGCFLYSSAPGNLGNTSVDMHGQYPSGTASAHEFIAGHYVYTLQCGPLQTTTAIDWIAGHPATSLTTTTNTGIAGIPFTLNWTTNAVPCVGSGGSSTDGWAGNDKGVTGAQMLTESVPGTYTFTLTCGTGVSTSTSHVTVTIPPPGVSIGATPSRPFTNRFATLNWNSSLSPCTSVDDTGGGGINWGGNLVYPVGSLPVFQSQPGTYTYAITCGTGAQAVHASTQITFIDVAPTTITPSAATTPVNTPVVLTWNSQEASSCVVSGGTGDDGWSGTLANSGSQTVTSRSAAIVYYSLNCDNITAGTTVTYTAVTASAPATPTPGVTLSASTSSQVAGQQVTLTWSSHNTDECTATGGVSGDGWSGGLGLSGSMPITAPGAETVTYSITCTGAPPAATALASVKFTASAGSDPGASSSGSGGGGGALDLFWLSALSALLVLRARATPLSPAAAPRESPAAARRSTRSPGRS